MATLWCGGEDIDFPNGTNTTATTASAKFRTGGWARCGISNGNMVSKSTVFPGGGVTSCWITCQEYIGNRAGVFSFGLGKSGVNGGIGVYYASASPFHIQLVSLNNSFGVTVLLDTNISRQVTSMHRWDMQVINFGASTTINLYLDGALIGTYSGAISIPGITNFDSVIFYGGGFDQSFFSEFIVTDVDSRSLIGLCTCAPNGNGSVQNWSNPAYTNFNPITINDTNSTFTNVTGQDEQVTIINTPAGNYQIDSVKIAARALNTAGAVATQVAFGFHNTNNNVTAVGSPHSLITAFQTVEEFLTIDPTTGTGFGTNFTGYQFDMRSS